MQCLKIKNWGKFQHFKDRTPPWVKLYRDLLDDPDWHELDGESAKTLIMLWLIASEDETHEGKLPDTRKLAFRLRTNEIKLKQQLIKLEHWLIQDDIKMISGRYQDDAPETETETETEAEAETRANKFARDIKNKTYTSDFLSFYDAYPRRVGKEAAWKAWIKHNGYIPPLDDLIKKINELKKTEDWKKDNGKFIPHPATWINGKRWEDEGVVLEEKSSW